MKPRTVDEWRVVLDIIDAFLKRLREADSDERLRMLEEGKQPRPAAEAKCERCGGTKRVYDLGAEQWPDACPNCSPAAHTAQVTRALEYGNTVAGFIGWLSADIPELRCVEVPRLAESYDRFLRRLAEQGSGGDST